MCKEMCLLYLLSPGIKKMTRTKFGDRFIISTPRPAVRKQQLTMISSSTNRDSSKQRDTRSDAEQ